MHLVANLAHTRCRLLLPCQAAEDEESGHETMHEGDVPFPVNNMINNNTSSAGENVKISRP